jgi:DNA-binding transcriptional ArsR family regulator
MDNDCIKNNLELPDQDAIDRAVKLFSTVSHPVRLLVLITLSRKGPTCAGELQKIAKIEQSAISHQLKVLKTAGLVKWKRDGKQIIYSIMDQHVVHIIEDAIAHISECL